MLIGLPAAGKSTICKELQREGFIIHSSDELRLEMFGSYNVFDKNTELFEELHRRIFIDLESGNDIVYDATNLSMKRRRYFLSQVSDNVFKEALVVATPIHTCMLRDSNRKKKVGDNVICRMWKSFQFPIYGEGFNVIDIRYTVDVDKLKYFSNYMKCADSFNQDNTNHTLTVGGHMKASSINYIKSFGLDITNKAIELKINDLEVVETINFNIATALLIHDVGKLFTKTFENKKGIVSEQAHYYNHQNVSAYEAMFANYICDSKEDIIHTCQLIQYHMQMHFINTSKSFNKWRKFLGDEMFEESLLVNKYDKSGK